MHKRDESYTINVRYSSIIVFSRNVTYYYKYMILLLLITVPRGGRFYIDGMRFFLCDVFGVWVFWKRPPEEKNTWDVEISQRTNDATIRNRKFSDMTTNWRWRKHIIFTFGLIFDLSVEIRFRDVYRIIFAVRWRQSARQ